MIVVELEIVIEQEWEVVARMQVEVVDAEE
jgi:hypothetical protein